MAKQIDAVCNKYNQQTGMSSQIVPRCLGNSARKRETKLKRTKREEYLSYGRGRSVNGRKDRSFHGESSNSVVAPAGCGWNNRGTDSTTASERRKISITDDRRCDRLEQPCYPCMAWETTGGGGRWRCWVPRCGCGTAKP